MYGDSGCMVKSNLFYSICKNNVILFILITDMLNICMKKFDAEKKRFLTK